MVVWEPVLPSLKGLGCDAVQEQQIRARQSMKQLSKHMTEQRMQALQRLRTNMMAPSVRILPRDMEQGLKEFASGVEQLVDRLVALLSCWRSSNMPDYVLVQLDAAPFPHSEASAVSFLYHRNC